MVFTLSKNGEHMVTSDAHPIRYAGFEQRLYACAIDMLILGVIALLFHLFSFGLLFLLLQAAYFIIFWHYGQGKTIGNKLMRIQVVSLDGKQLSRGKASIRYVGLLLSLLTVIGALWLLFSKKKQGLHDILAKTVVIKTH